jgi:outer membrane protein assembly factor BamA
VYIDVNNPGEKGVSMAKNEEVTIDQLAQQVEINLDMDYEKKDLKAQREQIKQNLYDGSKKLKHTVPKGKRV